jgi:hypothetical protein
MVHGTVKVVHGTVNLKMVHGTVEFVVHGTVTVVHETVVVHGTVKVGAWDGQLLEQIFLFLLFGISLYASAYVTLYYTIGSTSNTLPVSTGTYGDDQSCDL